MIPVTAKIALDEREIVEFFVRSSGPGGQSVNKVASAVQLRFDARRSPSLPADVRDRLERHRTQARNREDALARLLDLIRHAAQPPRKRRATRPPAAARERRIESKKRRAGIKRLRHAKPSFD